MTSKTIHSKNLREAARRAFSCWPSRIGAASLVALALTCGVDAVGRSPAVAVAANASQR